MNSAIGTPPYRPRIYAISHIRASRLVNNLLPAFAPLADIMIVNRTFEDALNAARELEKSRAVDVFLSAGSNGEYLRNNVSVPVVLIKVTGFDVLNAIVKARRVSNRIAIVTYKTTNPELEIVRQALNIDLEQRSYTTIDDAKDRFRELANEGYKVIVGSSLITDLAEENGLVGILLYSEKSIRLAIEDAIEIGRITKAEQSRRERLNTILRALNEGVVAVDMEERVHSINPAMEKLLNLSDKQTRTVGLRFSKISDLDLKETLRTGTVMLNQVQKIGNRMVVSNRIPIFEQGVQTGAVLTCQDAISIQQADRTIRSNGKGHNFIAKYQIAQILGDSTALRQAKLLASQYARTGTTVLLSGETGTGKELFAQGIHNASPRRSNPFVAINCAAFPESLLESELFGHEEGAFSGSKRGGKTGLFESAHTGTIFLDEVGDMPFPLQTRLLRVLQEKEILRVGSNEPMSVDVRIVAATNRDLKKSVAQGTFREDLFYRLNILRISLPPLRERMDDLPLIAAHLLREALARLGCDSPGDDLLRFLLPYFRNYPWPGNIRELDNVIERLAHYFRDQGLPGTTDVFHLQRIIPELFDGVDGEVIPEADAGSLRSIHRANEIAHIEKLMAACQGNTTEAARRLGISRTTLWRKLKRAQ